MSAATKTSSVIDPRDLRNALGSFATGVTVVTYEDDGQFFGTTVNSFTSVSLDPPLVLVSLATSTRAVTKIQDRPFAVNILHRNRQDLAWQFAGKPQEGLEFDWNIDGIAPRFADSHASFVCTPWAVHDAGDHVIVIGRVEDFETNPVDALVFYQGAFKGLTAETEAREV
jgi:flavin reductase (DIM6/NTAB) family NADH-FMN oxidoreductase RutF